MYSDMAGKEWRVKSKMEWNGGIYGGVVKSLL